MKKKSVVHYAAFCAFVVVNVCTATILLAQSYNTARLLSRTDLRAILSPKAVQTLDTLVRATQELGTFGEYIALRQQFLAEPEFARTVLYAEPDSARLPSGKYEHADSAAKLRKAALRHYKAHEYLLQLASLGCTTTDVEHLRTKGVNVYALKFAPNSITPNTIMFSNTNTLQSRYGAALAQAPLVVVGRVVHSEANTRQHDGFRSTLTLRVVATLKGFCPPELFVRNYGVSYGTAQASTAQAGGIPNIMVELDSPVFPAVLNTSEQGGYEQTSRGYAGDVYVWCLSEPMYALSVRLPPVQADMRSRWSGIAGQLYTVNFEQPRYFQSVIKPVLLQDSPAHPYTSDERFRQIQELMLRLR